MSSKDPKVDIAVIYEKLDRIERQTTKTNGKVRWLEKMVYTSIGGLAIISSSVVPLLVYIYLSSV